MSIVTIDLSKATPDQRAAVVSFINSFPSAAIEHATLAHEHESTMPALAFSAELTPEAAFGPLASGVPAPSIAGVAPLSIAPVAPPAPISTEAPSASLPNAASAAPIPPVPIAAPQSASPAGSVEVDKHGLPWDMRIHASTKTKVADGSWKMKRGTDPAVIATVEAELRQLMAVPTAAPAANWVQLNKTDDNPGIITQSGGWPFPAPAPAPDARQAFVALVGRTSAALQAGKVTQAEVAQCCNEAGIPALPLLANRLDLLPLVARNIDALIEARTK